MVNFPTQILTVTLTVMLFWIYFSSDAGICSKMAFPSLGNSDYGVASASTDCPPNSKWDALFHIIVYGFSRADLDGLRDHFRDVPWKDIFKLDASIPASGSG